MEDCRLKNQEVGQEIQGGHQGVKESRGVKNSGCRKFWGMKMSGIKTSSEQ